MLSKINLFLVNHPILMLTFHYFGEYSIYLLLIAFLYILYLREEKNKIPFVLLRAAIISVLFLILATAISRIVGIYRPFLYGYTIPCSIPENLYSYPSRHTLLATILAYGASKYDKKNIDGYFLWALLIGISRVFCGIHWFFDILAGFLFGLIGGYLAFGIIK